MTTDDKTVQLLITSLVSQTLAIFVATIVEVQLSRLGGSITQHLREFACFLTYAI
jgi:hypothetical protein